MNDKSRIPVGDPGVTEAATSHMRKAVTTKKVTLESSDHNYYSVNLTPSVTLLCDLPEKATESFFTGQVYVRIKDSIFEPSDPLRHVVELLFVLWNEQETFFPYLTIFTDGGGDHNIKYLYVQCILLALFKIGNFDILSVGHCTPNQSWLKPAERCMSLFNIGLQGLDLQSDHTGLFESKISSCKVMKALQSKADQLIGFKETFMSSTEHSRQFAESSFSGLELKGKQLKIFQPSRSDSEIINALHKIEPLIKDDGSIPHLQAKLHEYPSLEKYFEAHMKEGLYLLQFQKCMDDNCCMLIVEPLPSPIPAPVLAPDGLYYLPFDDLYGKATTTEEFCPSLK